MLKICELFVCNTPVDCRKNDLQKANSPQLCPQWTVVHWPLPVMVLSAFLFVSVMT